MKEINSFDTLPRFSLIHDCSTATTCRGSPKVVEQAQALGRASKNPRLLYYHYLHNLLAGRPALALARPFTRPSAAAPCNPYFSYSGNGSRVKGN